MIDYPLNIADYDYPLTENRIAKYPLSERDLSKLLVYDSGKITDSSFLKINEHLPNGSMLVFNNTRVIRARLIFQKESGTHIEIFCLQPEGSYGQTGGKAIWKCLIGNAKRWKSGNLALSAGEGIEQVTLIAQRGEQTADAHMITFFWNNPEMAFEQVLELAGKIPLPPYLNRAPEQSDIERYQTIYAQFNGSVAAPTAGLHFTTKVLESIEEIECSFEYLTLHVGAGTFKPVSVEDARHHNMHEEELIVEKQLILKLLQNITGNIIPVGTTSMRSLESLYWLGCRILQGNEPGDYFFIDQWEPYKNESKIPATEALQAIYDYFSRKHLQSVSGFTQIMIVPGYRFRICTALITNFHQPKSTLLLLVAALIGENWEKVYKHALEHNYRFLSYGDSCLFFTANN
ncbi:MAG: S-adenosylmethionine:tRNA ribosyltransferase-isomerase [Lentimicrobium sp.]|nr:S-adenosylmethionine:tRNA ribosyltransferase-isomerase [Lentimicrobium sp.]